MHYKFDRLHPGQTHTSKGKKWHFHLSVRRLEVFWQPSSQLQTQTKITVHDPHHTFFLRLVLHFYTDYLTCGGRRGRRIKARSTPRSCCRCCTSYRTHIIKAWKIVSSSGTLMSSLESSLTISAVGSSRNSWFWMTSRKCSWNTEETWRRQIIISH